MWSLFCSKLILPFEFAQIKILRNLHFSSSHIHMGWDIARYSVLWCQWNRYMTGVRNVVTWNSQGGWEDQVQWMSILNGRSSIKGLENNNPLSDLFYFILISWNVTWACFCWNSWVSASMNWTISIVEFELSWARDWASLSLARRAPLKQAWVRIGLY